LPRHGSVSELSLESVIHAWRSVAGATAARRARAS
jgi:hypothetical protein